MGVTKTDFMRGMQCPKMLWLDRHHPEYKVIPSETQRRLDRGNEFGDKAMGLFGPYTEVREYYPGTTHPDKNRMPKRTLELLDNGTLLICEAAFLDSNGNYCAVAILRRTDSGYKIYEVKNSPEVSEQHIKDAGFKAYIIKSEIGLNLTKVSIIYNSGIQDSPYEFKDETPLCKFRHFPEKKGLNKLFFDAINRVMVQTGHMMKGGTIVDAAIISAPGSAKNAAKSRDPEMYQTKKGNE